VSTSIDAKLRHVQALLNTVLAEAGERTAEPHSHWELPILPPPDAEGQLSSTDLLNWWFRGPQGRPAESTDWNAGGAGGASLPAVDPSAPAVDPRAGTPPMGHDAWSEISMLFPEPEEHLAEEHAQAAVDCLYDFLHAVGRRDVQAAAALIHEGFHTIENGEEIDKRRFVDALAAHAETLHGWDVEVSLAVAPEPINHPLGVLIHAIVQFDAVNLADGSKNGHVEERLAVLRDDESGAWAIGALPRVNR
jgi:hypothetical protein